MIFRKILLPATFVLSVLLSYTVSAQSLSGRWQLRGSYLKITYSVKWKVVKVTNPKTGYVATEQPLVVEFYDDGRVKFGNETDTYTRSGNRLIMGVANTNGFDYQLGNGELTLWMSNQAAGVSAKEAKAKALLLARQMKMFEQFPDLSETEDVTNIQVGMVFDFKGPVSSQGERAAKGRIDNTQRNNTAPATECAVTAGEQERIIQKAKSLDFDDEILSYLSSAVKNKKCFKTSQIRQMLDLLSFDKDKLPLAQAAYRSVTDPENYYELEEAFDFMNTKRQFRDMLK